MSDELEETDAREAQLLEAGIARVQRETAKIPKGHPGECFFCGEEFTRVVTITYKDTARDACARCRDARGIK